MPGQYTGHAASQHPNLKNALPVGQADEIHNGALGHPAPHPRVDCVMMHAPQHSAPMGFRVRNSQPAGSRRPTQSKAQKTSE